MKKAIVLASGGLDSTLVMYKLLKEKYDVYPFFGNYNQYCLENERRSINLVTAWLVSYVSSIPGSGILHDVTEVHIDTGIPHIAACPGRVLSFVGAAAIWAFTKGWTGGSVAIGIHMGDKDVDSCRVGYETSLNATLQILTQGQLDIITPLMGMSREEMALKIGKIGIPFKLMMNCYWNVPCGWQSKNMHYLCPGCRRKQEAMKILGMGNNDYFDRPNCEIMDTPITRRDWAKLT